MNNCHPLEVVVRGGETQLQVSDIEILCLPRSGLMAMIVIWYHESLESKESMSLHDP